MRRWRGRPHLHCPCCDNQTIRGPGCYEVCSVCFWEGDPGQTRDFDAGGANPPGLGEARWTYRQIGACEPSILSHVRPSRPEELPPEV